MFERLKERMFGKTEVHYSRLAVLEDINNTMASIEAIIDDINGAYFYVDKKTTLNQVKKRLVACHRCLSRLETDASLELSAQAVGWRTGLLNATVLVRDGEENLMTKEAVLAPVLTYLNGLLKELKKTKVKFEAKPRKN
ncbi:MAG TPA: hypothetical protein VJB66_02475 [Candidatus Nanoarchaeia archaeon]|nr:hypothetical protein [Candidatus Nanoarchaeia archaeon]